MADPDTHDWQECSGCHAVTLAGRTVFAERLRDTCLAYPAGTLTGRQLYERVAITFGDPPAGHLVQRKGPRSYYTPHQIRQIEHAARLMTIGRS